MREGKLKEEVKYKEDKKSSNKKTKKWIISS